ncbi:helix-turn-helix domain-containing protein [Nocardioides pocheonensis]|uniref:helix-turn-helix domain-containing protein n=1 Tax=Nocardioides pocheonensis TaxID=661485 RepID=UPI00248221FA|nr:GAF domain-containing protein [Nocardioides pocheonensis]
MDLRSWLSAISGLTAAVNVGHDLPELLELVAETARHLLDLDFCGIMLPSDDGTSLRIAAASGLPGEYVATINETRPIALEPDASRGAPASRAFRSGKPSSVSDVELEPVSSWSHVAREQGYRSILAVPLVTTAGVLGTLNSYRSAVHQFTTEEVEQLALLAEHAAIAIRSAQVLDDLREQHELIVRSEQIHDRFVRIAAESGGVAGIATALCELVGCEVTVLDSDGEVLATEPARRPAPEAPVVVPQREVGERRFVRDDGPDAVADVVLDGTVVAIVRLAGQAGRLDPLGVRAVEHACVVLALEVLRQRTAAAVEARLRGDLLIDLIGGADPNAKSVRERARLMGHQLAAEHHVVVAEAHGRGVSPAGEPVRDAVELARRAAAEALRRTSHLRPRPLIGALRGVVVALWPSEITTPSGEDVLRRAIAATYGGATSTVAVVPPAGAGLAAAYRTARGALAFAAAEPGSDRVVTLDDLGAAGPLLQFAEPAALRRYADRTVGPVIRYDADHGTDLLRTLRAYLDADLDRAATAELLVVHPNTVSQRIRRVESLTGLNLRSPRSVVEARTALLLSDVARAGEHGVVN